MRNLGNLAEKIAKKFLTKKGYKIIKTNYWIKRYGEIDIIALKDNIYYFFEVKSGKKNNIVDPSFHYNRNKQERLEKIILHYVNRNRIDEYKRCLITIMFGEKIKIKIFENV